MRNNHLTKANANRAESDRALPAWRRLWEARSATVFVYLFRFAFAFSVAWPFATQVDFSSHRQPNTVQTPEALNILLFIENLRNHLPSIHEQRLSAIGISLLYLFLIPLVSMIWIHAIDRPRSLQASVAEAARCYHASLLISLLFLIALAISITLIFGFGWAVHRGLWFVLNDRIRDTICSAVILPASFPVVFLLVSYDTARSALCLENSTSFAIRFGLAAAFNTTSVLSYLFWFGCAALLTISSALPFVFQENGFTQSFFLSFILLQTVALTRTILRGRWLVTARNIVYRIY